MAIVLGGCATSDPATNSRTDATPSRESAQRPVDLAWGRNVTLADGRTGAAMNWNDLIDRARSSEAVLWGEIHGHERGLATAAALWQDLLEVSPDAALAMEFYERDHQAALDDYLMGVTDAESFAQAASRRAGNDPAGHRTMVDAAKRAGVPVIAANAPRRYVRLVRTDGMERVESLRRSQTGLYRVPDPAPGGSYRERFFELMGGGGHGDEVDPAVVEGFYRAQSMWDTTMADSVARALSDGRSPVVLVVGRFHVEHDGGTLQMLDAYRPGTRTLSVVIVDETVASLREEHLGLADVVVYAGPREQDG